MHNVGHWSIRLYLETLTSNLGTKSLCMLGLLVLWMSYGSFFSSQMSIYKAYRFRVMCFFVYSNSWYNSKMVQFKMHLKGPKILQVSTKAEPWKLFVAL
jgi:hypothetical protein